MNREQGVSAKWLYATCIIALLLSACAGSQPWIGSRTAVESAAEQTLRPKPEPTKPWPVGGSNYVVAVTAS